ncbi:winged helix-turn-helix domain-containing protein [Kribbella sp. NBC_01245]|uniref:AfsR/SARP family transcriptional regulator n=1 Tax=Kribbella sp. NBC_01245 TaxID=2903578 RepID=UPI002E2C44CE|nr:BTAD domain-containing putative transcriptional regulator [Kribbella sp. NBC_01245]
MEFRLLGPVQIWADGNQVALKRRPERLLLAILLLEPGRTVPIDRLIELLWPEDRPANPRRALQVYASRLRAVLGPELLTSRHDGYQLAGATDVARFAALLERARTEPNLPERSRLLGEALALWRGPALADVASEDVRRRLCAGLEESRRAAVELRFETELALGRHESILPELASLTSAEPTREALAAARMLALYRSGRQADAIAAYAEFALYLADELGSEPGPELRELHVAILRQDPALDLPGAHDLPEAPAALKGRDALLDELAVGLEKNSPGGVPTIICLYGAAGVGKSSIAIALAHRVVGVYPDGQLYQNLETAVSPRDALGRLLGSLGVEPPDSVEERSALFRSHLADRAVLLLLDNCNNVAQIRPLLPATGRCAVLITSQLPLIGLEDATHIEVSKV